MVGLVSKNLPDFKTQAVNCSARYLVLGLLISILCMCLPCWAKDNLTISHVTVDNHCIYPLQQQAALIAYRLSQPAQVTIKIFNNRDNLVKTLVNSEDRPIGDNKEAWNAVDDAGSTVPPGIYHFTIEARNEKGRTVLSDLTDISGGEKNQVASEKIDLKQGQISYVLKSPCLVITRVGIGSGGPFLRTLEYREAKPAGLNTVPWDGFDSTGKINVSNHSNLKLRVQAYSLNDNCIVVAGTNQTTGMLSSVAAKNNEKRLRIKKPKKEIRNHWQHLPEVCHDPMPHIAISSDTQFDSEGIPIVSGPLRLTITVPQEDEQLVAEERFELMFFVDYIFVYEEEAGFLPFNWTWDPKSAGHGIHYITVNIIGYEGHIGSSSIKVRLR